MDHVDVLLKMVGSGMPFKIRFMIDSGKGILRS